ncbi:MAG: hypothetical protein AAGC55_33655, partial [Myxococcota bacterium]
MGGDGGSADGSSADGGATDGGSGAIELLMDGTYLLHTTEQRLYGPDGAVLAADLSVFEQGQGEREAIRWTLVSLTIRNSVTLRVTGNRPMIIEASESIVIDGKLNVSSQRGEGGNIVRGAGDVPPDKCGLSVGADGSTPFGGGGGGAHGSDGGDGGSLGGDGGSAIA